MPRADKLQESDLLKLKLLIPRENHDSAEEIDPRQNCWGGSFDAGTLRRSVGCLGKAARDGRFLRRSTDLRFAQVDYVLAQVLLLLCASQAEFSRTLRFPRSHAEGSPSATKRPRIEVQGVSHHSDQAPR